MKIDFSMKSTKNISLALYERLLNNKFQVLTMHTGTGKTAIAVLTAGLLAHHVKQDINVFLIATRNKLDEGSWEDVIDQYNSLSKYKLNLIAKETPRGLIDAKKNDDYLVRDLKQMEKEGIDTKSIKQMKKWIKQTSKETTVFIIDEVQNFKNATRKQSKSLQKLLKKSKGIGIGLSATPMSNGMVQDGISYLVLNGLYKSENDFKNEHIYKQYHNDKFYRPDIFLPDGRLDENRFINLDIFNNNIDKTVFIPETKIDLKLPNTNIYNKTYQLSNSTSKKIEQCNNAYKERRYDSYMQYLMDIKKLIGADENHRNELKQIIKSNDSKQPLIFYYSNEELKAIINTLNSISYEYSIINGENSIKNIDKNNVNQAIVIQYKAGGAGIEFPKSNLSIIYGLQYSWQDTEQALGRNVRSGMSHDVKQYFLISTHPHDDNVFVALKKKKEFTEEFLEKLAIKISENYSDKLI